MVASLRTSASSKRAMITSLCWGVSCFAFIAKFKAYSITLTCLDLSALGVSGGGGGAGAVSPAEPQTNQLMSKIPNNTAHLLPFDSLRTARGGQYHSELDLFPLQVSTKKWKKIVGVDLRVENNQQVSSVVGTHEIKTPTYPWNLVFLLPPPGGPLLLLLPPAPALLLLLPPRPIIRFPKPLIPPAIIPPPPPPPPPMAPAERSCLSPRPPIPLLRMVRSSRSWGSVPASMAAFRAALLSFTLNCNSCCWARWAAFFSAICLTLCRP